MVCMHATVHVPGAAIPRITLLVNIIFFTAVQIFSFTDPEELLHDASLYAIYYVIIAIVLGSLRFTAVRPRPC